MKEPGVRSLRKGETLFTKYLQGVLSEAETRKLRNLLGDEAVARRFVRFVQEWSLIALLSAPKSPPGRE